MRFTLLLALAILTGCSSFSFKDNISDVAAVGATTVCAVLDPTLGVACGVGTGIAVNTVTEIKAEVDLEQVQNEHQEAVAKAQVKGETIEGVAREIVIGLIIFFGVLPIITGWIGARRKRPEEYALQAKVDEMERVRKEGM